METLKYVGNYTPVIAAEIPLHLLSLPMTIKRAFCPDSGFSSQVSSICTELGDIACADGLCGSLNAHIVLGIHSHPPSRFTTLVLSQGVSVCDSSPRNITDCAWQNEVVIIFNNAGFIIGNHFNYELIVLFIIQIDSRRKSPNITNLWFSPNNNSFRRIKPVIPIFKLDD